MKNKICRKCGKEYLGSPHSWYCVKCKNIIINEQREKELQRIKSKRLEMVCVICGKKFISYHRKATCSRICEIKLKGELKQGRKLEKTTKEKIAQKNSYQWHLVSPEGKHYKFKNLTQWARENSELFGFEKSEQNAKKIVSGISQAKSGKIVSTYKNWQIIDNPSEYGPTQIVDLYKNGFTINKIHEITGKSSSKIRKLLITRGLWTDELTVKVLNLLKDGKTEKEIAQILNKSTKLINSRCPYTKGMYGWNPSPNALQIREYRQRNDCFYGKRGIIYGEYKRTDKRFL